MRTLIKIFCLFNILVLNSCVCTKEQVVLFPEYPKITLNFNNSIDNKANYLLIYYSDKNQSKNKLIDSVLIKEKQLEIYFYNNDYPHNNYFFNQHFLNDENNYYIEIPEIQKSYFISNIKLKFKKKPTFIKDCGKDIIEARDAIDSTYCTINGVNQAFRDNLTILE